MSFGQSPENFAYLFLLTLAVLPAFFVILFVGRVLKWILRIQGDAFTLIFTAVVVVGAVLGASIYLDRYGAIVPGSVVKKVEEVEYRAEGDWQDHLTLTIAYTPPGQSPATVTLSPPPAEFDALREGSPVSLRVLSLDDLPSLAQLDDLPSLARLADQSTLTWLPWRWIGIVVGLLGLGIVFWKLSDTRVGCLPGILFVCLLAAAPLANKWWQWRQSLDPALTPLRISGIVTDVRRVTWIDPLPAKDGRGSNWQTGFNVPQPYDIVTVRFQPAGYGDTVLGVDAVDAGHPEVQPGMPVVVLYSATNPRQVRIPDARRLHYWLNPMGWAQNQILTIALFVGLIVALSQVGQRLKAWWRQRLDEALGLLTERSRANVRQQDHDSPTGRHTLR